MAEYRGAARARAACLASGECSRGDAALANFTRLLLKVPEHTWGADVKAALGDWGRWANADLHAALAAREPAYQARAPGSPPPHALPARRRSSDDG